MSQFNQSLDQARGRHRKTLFLWAGVVLLAALLVYGFFLHANATRLVILPEAAEPSFTLESGLGTVVDERLYLLSGAPVLKVSAPGFYEEILTVPEDVIGGTFQLSLREKPARLILSTPSESDDIKWFINGMEKAQGANLDIRLVPGTYEILAQSPYHEDARLTETFERAEEFNHRFSLHPLKGQISISSQPPGADVTLAGDHVGQTPLVLERDAGRYDVVLQKDGYDPLEAVLDLNRHNLMLGRDFRLIPKQARLLLSLSPPGGQVLVDGKAARLEDDGTLPLEAHRSYLIAYQKAGFRTETVHVMVNAGPNQPHAFSLEPVFGILDIQSFPEGEVFINRQSHGRTPLSLKLPAMAQHVSVQKDGYETQSEVVRLKPGETHKIRFQLLTQDAARLARAVDVYETKAGGQMKLFKPDETYTMGAERHEQGQRANEILRTVQLDRPFYAGVYEVTAGEFAKFSKEGSPDDQRPVTQIDWETAAAFCNWLSRAEGMKDFYRLENGRVTGFDPASTGYRLLSEAEWEWLARKASRSGMTRFAFGDETTFKDNVANIADETARNSVRYFVPGYHDGYGGMAPVGQFKPEISGLYDQGGNVSEWVHDVYSIVPPKPNEIHENPLGRQAGKAHVVKGANYRSGRLTELRAAFREGLGTGRDDVGFRIGRYVTEGR